MNHGLILRMGCKNQIKFLNLYIFGIKKCLVMNICCNLFSQIQRKNVYVFNRYADLRSFHNYHVRYLRLFARIT